MSILFSKMRYNSNPPDYWATVQDEEAHKSEAQSAKNKKAKSKNEKKKKPQPTPKAALPEDQHKDNKSKKKNNHTKSTKGKFKTYELVDEDDLHEGANTLPNDVNGSLKIKTTKPPSSTSQQLLPPPHASPESTTLASPSILSAPTLITVSNGDDENGPLPYPLSAPNSPSKSPSRSLSNFNEPKKQLVEETVKTKRQLRQEKCKSCCKSFVAFLFSTLGLTCVMVGYAIFGGFIFMKLEAPNEKTVKTDVQDTRRQHVDRLWFLTEEMNVFHRQNWTIVANHILDNYTKAIYKATKFYGWDGNDGESDVQWTFAGALLYSITVITTIGYGHIAPKTMWGRIVTILYAIVGIPITLCTLANMGGFMATAFRFIYKNICCGLCCICCIKPTEGELRSVAIRYRKHDMKRNKSGTPSALAVEDADHAASCSLTAGSEADDDSDNIDEDEEAVIGGNGDDKSFKIDKNRLEVGKNNYKSAAEQRRKSKRLAKHRQKYPVKVYWRTRLRRVFDVQNTRQVSVPISVSLLVITSYILSGALMFTLWERDWDFLIGSYFCFITLTTIGFGDYVPGTNVDSWGAQEKLVLCTIYLIFGLALCAMCFDLMQEEARNKIRYLGEKIGLLSSEKEKNEKNNRDKSSPDTV